MKKIRQILIIGILAILTIMVTACTPKNETQQQTQHQAETTEQPQVNYSDFIMDDTILLHYLGSGGSVVIPDGVITIDREVFKGKNLTSVVIPNSVTHISHWAFANNQLTSVVIPDSVKYIGMGAFEDNQLPEADAAHIRSLYPDLSSLNFWEQAEWLDYLEEQALTAGPYAKILNGDLYEFAGTWINGRGNSSELTSDGLFDGGYFARDFKKNGAGANEIYSWWVSKDGDGYEVRLYPAGIEIMSWDNQIMHTDTTKARISVYANSSDEVYYHAWSVPARVQEETLHMTTNEWSDPVISPVPVKLVPGSFINGYIEQGEEHWFRVTTTGSGFDFLIVETTGSTDTTLEAFTESLEHINANYIKQDQNVWVGIDIWGVKTGTTYIFRLRSSHSGPYRILAREAVAAG